MTDYWRPPGPRESPLSRMSEDGKKRLMLKVKWRAIKEIAKAVARALDRRVPKH